MARDFAPDTAGAGDRGVVHGLPLRYEDGCDGDLVRAIAGRVARGGSLTSWQDEGRTQSLAEAWDRAARLACGLIAAGVAPGQLVAIVAHDVLDFIPLLWACLRGGYTCVPLGGVVRQAIDQGRPEVLQDVLKQLGAPVVVAEGGREAALRAAGGCRVLVLDGLEAEDGAWQDRPVARVVDGPALVVATSGSTGRMKLVRMAAAASFQRNFHVVADDDPDDTRRLSVFELDSITGLRMAWLHYRDQVHIPPAAAAGAPLRILDCAERMGLTSIYFPTTLMTRVVEAQARQVRRWDLSRLRQVRLGSEAALPAVARAFRNLAGGTCRVITGYGSTETGMIVTGGDACRDDFDLGGPVAGGALRIVRRDDDDRILAVAGDGEAGEVELRAGAALFSGYWGEPDIAPEGGWWRTGDRGSLRDGVLRLHGRLKDVLVAGGRKHALADIEAVVAPLLPAAHQVHAVAMHSESGERLGLAVTDLGAQALDGLRPRIRAAIGQRFGVQPGRLLALAASDVPRTAAGKLDRAHLAQKLAAAVDAVPAARGEAATTVLGRLWQEALNTPSPPVDSSHFYADGGDSLASATLFAGIEARLGYRLSPEVFFRDPTFGALARRIGGEAAPVRDAGPRWPLPGDAERKLLTYVETWAGERPTPDRLVCALNPGGTRTPLFWVFQSAKEFAALAGALGPDQPLYGLRSGHQVLDYYDEDELQSLALRYVQDICAVRPEGEIVIGGNCQGAVVAQAVAQHLMRRRRHVPLLVLMEWGFALQPYAGPVLLVYGRDSDQGNPALRHQVAELAFGRAWPDWRTAEIPGRHGTFFRPDQVGALAEVLGAAMAQAIPVAPRFLPRSAQRAAILAEIPATWRCRERRRVIVRVRNSSPVDWSGVALSAASCWYAQGEMTMPLDGRTRLPALRPGEGVEVELEITAPERAGSYELVVDVVEEGGVWFHPVNDGVARVAVEVVPVE